MKKLFYLLVVSLIMLGCSNNEPKMGGTYINEPSKKENTEDNKYLNERHLKGVHKLAKIKDGKYLLYYNVTEYRPMFCSFIWETNDGYYSNNYLYVTKIRFEVDPTVKEPYIKFNWKPSTSNSSLQTYVYNVNFLVVVTNSVNFQEIISYANQPNGHIDIEND